MRESTLASILPDLTKEQVKNAVKRHNNRFTPKYRAFFILQNKIEEIVQRTTKSWRNLYKKIEDLLEEEYKEEVAAPIEERRKRREEKIVEEKKVEEEEKKEEVEKKKEEKKNGKEEETQKQEKAIAEQEQQPDQSVQDTQLPPPSPPQATISPTETVTIVDVPDTSS